MEILTKLSTSHPSVWTSSSVNKTFPWYHMCTHTHAHTQTWSHFHQRLCLVWLLWLWMSLISTVTTLTEIQDQKNIMITSDCIFQRQSALFFFPVQWFKVQNNTRKWEKMEITLDGWLTAGMFYSKLVQNFLLTGRPKWDVMILLVPQCQNKLGNEHQIWNWKYYDHVPLPWMDFMPAFWIEQAIFKASLCVQAPFRQSKQLWLKIWLRLGTLNHLNILVKVRVSWNLWRKQQLQSQEKVGKLKTNENTSPLWFHNLTFYVKLWFLVFFFCHW